MKSVLKLVRYVLKYSEKMRNFYLPKVCCSSQTDLKSSFYALQYCAPLGGPLLSSLDTPPVFFSITPSKLSKENAHFLFAEQSSPLLCLVVPKYITIQKRSKWVPPIGQSRPIKPHEKTSCVNSWDCSYSNIPRPFTIPVLLGYMKNKHRRLTHLPENITSSRRSLVTHKTSCRGTPAKHILADVVKVSGGNSQTTNYELWKQQLYIYNLVKTDCIFHIIMQ